MGCSSGECRLLLSSEVCWGPTGLSSSRLLFFLIFQDPPKKKGTPPQRSTREPREGSYHTSAPLAWSSRGWSWGPGTPVPLGASWGHGLCGTPHFPPRRSLCALLALLLPPFHRAGRTEFRAGATQAPYLGIPLSTFSLMLRCLKYRRHFPVLLTGS